MRSKGSRCDTAAVGTYWIVFADVARLVLDRPSIWDMNKPSVPMNPVCS